jgi:hypothetical protein
LRLKRYLSSRGILIMMELRVIMREKANSSRTISIMTSLEFKSKSRRNLTSI